MGLWISCWKMQGISSSYSPAWQIAVKLAADGKEVISLEVCDSGEAIEPRRGERIVLATVGDAHDVDAMRYLLK